MLQSLHVKNLALMDDVEVEFSKGLNILTGETGAGKSMILGSIHLALGQKVSKEMLKENGEAAFVELVFLVENGRVKTCLKEMDIEAEEDIVILSRKITCGKSVARINGEAVSASKLKAVASLLIDIHGQHEHQSLLSKKKQLDILDAYAKKELAELKEQLKEDYQKYKKIKEEWEHSNLNIEDRKRELAFLEYEVNEIEEAQLCIGEDEELEKEFKRFSNSRKIMQSINAAYEATAGEAESASVFIGRALREISLVSEYDKQIEGLEAQLYDMENLLHDFNHELYLYLSDMDFEEETYYQIEKRLDTINHLKSKYGNSIKIILEAYEAKCQRIAVLKDYDEYLHNISVLLKEAEEHVKKLCETISKIRKEQAAIFCEAITQALQDLNFLDVVFRMEFGNSVSFSANGYDDPEFLISTNPGEPIKPLGKIASGGELSRIMLAIKTIMADTDEIESLIFDEIDSGISGRTAQMVAEKMNLLGKNHQIICITHLPQIAAMADKHFLIEKKVEKSETHSYIRELSEQQSVSELARMLGGVEITDVVLQNAKEMKELAYMKK